MKNLILQLKTAEIKNLFSENAVASCFLTEIENGQDYDVLIVYNKEKEEVGRINFDPKGAEEEIGEGYKPFDVFCWIMDIDDNEYRKYFEYALSYLMRYLSREEALMELLPSR